MSESKYQAVFGVIILGQNPQIFMIPIYTVRNTTVLYDKQWIPITYERFNINDMTYIILCTCGFIDRPHAALLTHHLCAANDTCSSTLQEAHALSILVMQYYYRKYVIHLHITNWHWYTVLDIIAYILCKFTSNTLNC